MNDKTAFLNVPPLESGTYKRNFIDTAVCELRFPVLLELERSVLASFQKKLRREYPFFEKQKTIEIGDESGGESRYLFRSKTQSWTVTLRNFSLALETNKYVDFDDFYERLKSLLEIATSLIDSDFFTRVGLRYINSVPIEDNKLDGLIKRDLVTPIVQGDLGDVNRYACEILGITEFGSYALRHGLKPQDSSNQIPLYFLDFDYFDENVDVNDTLSKISNFNRINFSFFHWCLGPKAIQYLGEAKPKKEGR